MAVELALALAQLALPEQPPGPERELAADDVSLTLVLPLISIGPT